MRRIFFTLLTAAAVLFASQVLAYELLVLSGDKSQNSKRWKEEVLPEYGKSDTGKKLPAKVISIQGNKFPDWLSKAMQDGRVGEIAGTPTFIIWDAKAKKEMGRVEGYTQKAAFYSQLEEALTMVGKGMTPGRREGSGSEQHEGSGGGERHEGSSGNKDIMEHMYKTPEEAKRASEKLGLGGQIHTHETPDGLIYMPGTMQ